MLRELCSLNYSRILPEHFIKANNFSTKLKPPTCRGPSGHVGPGLPGVELGAEIEERAAEEIAWATRQLAFTLLGFLTLLFAILAAKREWQCPQSRLRDLVAALEAVAVEALHQPAERLVDLGQRVDLHLEKREVDVLTRADLGVLGEVPDLVASSRGVLVAVVPQPFPDLPGN